MLFPRKERDVPEAQSLLHNKTLSSNPNSNIFINSLTYFSLHMSPPHGSNAGYQMYPPMSGGSGNGKRKADMIMRTTVKSNNSNSSWQG